MTVANSKGLFPECCATFTYYIVTILYFGQREQCQSTPSEVIIECID